MTFPFTVIFIWLVFWRPQEWLFPWLYGWPLLDVIICVAILSLLMEISQGVTRFAGTPAAYLAVGLWFATLMSHIANTYFAGLVAAVPESFKICFFLLLLLVVIDRVSRLRIVINVMLLAGVMMAVDALMQYNYGRGFSGATPLVYFHVFKGAWITQTQFLGIFSDPNDLGQFLVACVPFAFVTTKRFGFQGFTLGLLLAWLLTAALLTTHSRGALVGAIASFSVLLFLRLPPKWMPYVAALGLIGGLIACAGWGVDWLDESAHDRVMFWGNANRYFKTHPLFGGGFLMFNDLTGADRPAHNAYVTCYTELGFFGYWFWFSTMTLGFIGCYRTRVAFRRARTDAAFYLRRAAGCAMASMAGFAASAYFLSRAYVFPMFILYGILNVIPVIAGRYLPEDHPPLINWRNDVLIAGTISSVLSIIYIYVTILLLNRGNG